MMFSLSPPKKIAMLEKLGTEKNKGDYLGYVDGISGIIMKHLNDIDVTKRPMFGHSETLNSY